MKIIIPSKGRSDIIRDKALRLFPDATLCIGDDERAAFAQASDPDGIGTGPAGRPNHPATPFCLAAARGADAATRRCSSRRRHGPRRAGI